MISTKPNTILQNNSVVSAKNGEDENKGSNKRRAVGKKRKTSRPRFAFQTKSADDILDDGYRWRKYGQKAVKNSAYPRYIISDSSPDHLLINIITRSQLFFIL